MTPQLRDHERYDILGEHGRGGLGRVSRAHDRELGRDIAIKELISRGQLSEMRFLREALITARLEHPGIVPVYEAGRWADGTPFYAMKLVAGRPLRDLILERTTVDERIALLHHVIAVADAMAYAHGRNIIHRDLKPSNVIVGDFGETVVIDWGLAKDLAAAEEHVTGGPFRTNGDDGLTSTGTILGTPAYMAPEQARGEPVAQPADVYAIGAMLWELCSLHKLPPNFSGQRRHAIRRAGIDPDLATIIDKACDPDPARRYPDAGGLASDLRAFKAGARIAARRYSFWALLAHWTRRHRLVAIAMTCAIVLSAAGILYYVHSIRAERSEAEVARRAAQQSNAATAVALAKETLGHAEVLLQSDPTAALDVLRSYRGDDQFRLGVLRAEAEGRGVARLSATPSDDAIVWIQRLSETEIASFSQDGSLVVTTTSGTVKVIPRSANAKPIWAFDAKRKLFAYVCTENEICLVDMSTPLPAISAHLDYLAPEGLTFSADAQLVAVSRINDLAIWNILDIAHPGAPTAHRIRGFHAEFLDDEALAIVDSSETAIYTRLHRAAAIPTPGITSVAASRTQGVIAVGSEDGSATLLHRDPRVAPHHKQLCAGPLKALTLGSADDAVAFGCKDGNVGLWLPDRSETMHLATLSGSVNELAMSADGHRLGAGGSSGVFSIIDVDAKLAASYIGHNGRISAIAALDEHGIRFATGDLSGNLRAWQAPPKFARIPYAATARLYDISFLTDSSQLATTSVDPYIHFVEDRQVSDAARHDPGNMLLESAPDGSRFAAFGSQESIELWDGTTHRLTETIDTHHSETVQLKFLSPDEIVYASNDGAVVGWKKTSGATQIASLHRPITTFVELSNKALVVELRDGTLWQVSADKPPAAVPQQHAREHLMQLSKDRRWLVTSSSDGDATVYDMTSFNAVLDYHSNGRVHHIALSPANDLLAIAMKSGEIQIARFPVHGGTADWKGATWHQFAAHPRFLAFSPKGDLLMITNSDGVLWFYSPSVDRWLYFASGAPGLAVLRPAPDGRHAASVDSSGRVMLIDLDLIRHSIMSSNHD